MKCLVCGKNYEAAECPRCHFPYIQVPAAASETFLESLRPTVNSYRGGFLQQVKLQIPIYRWKDQDGVVVEDRVETISLGTADQLKAGARWLEEKFARIPDEKEIPVTVSISAGGDTWERTIAVPNLHQPELQQVGVVINDEYHILLMLRNETEQNTVSDPVPLFDL